MLEQNACSKERDRLRAEEFVRLLQAHQNQLFGYILAVVHNPTEAEDLFQQTSLILWKKFSQFEGGDFYRWAQAIARFEISNYFKRQRRSRVCFNDELLEQIAEEQVAQAPAVSARRDALAKCMERLAAAEKRLVALCYGSSESIKDIAAKEGKSAPSVYKSLSRIRHALFACIRQTIAEEGQA